MGIRQADMQNSFFSTWVATGKNAIHDFRTFQYFPPHGCLRTFDLEYKQMAKMHKNLVLQAYSKTNIAQFSCFANAFFLQLRTNKIINKLYSGF